jgi:predicted cupin superfamily sugar epimerase
MDERMRPTADEIKRILGLEPHPTCGWTALSYLSPHRVANDTLPAGYRGTHTLASVLYFLVVPERPMKLHRLRSDQIYHHYLGDPLEVLVLLPDGGGALAVVGSDLAAGMRPQLLIPGGTWHVSRVKAGGSYALLGTTEWPGFDPSDLEIGDVAALIEVYPQFRAEIAAFTATD